MICTAVSANALFHASTKSFLGQYSEGSVPQEARSSVRYWATAGMSFLTNESYILVNMESTLAFSATRSTGLASGLVWHDPNTRAAKNRKRNVFFIVF